MMNSGTFHGNDPGGDTDGRPAHTHPATERAGALVEVTGTSSRSPAYASSTIVAEKTWPMIDQLFGEPF